MSSARGLFPDTLVLVKGGGDLGTGVAWRLHKAGFPVLVAELALPLAVRRTVAFASAIYESEVRVEGITARRAATFEEARQLLAGESLPVLVDPEAQAREFFAPSVLIDAIMAKRNTGTRRADASLVMGLGPGFTPGIDCHAVIETNRGHNLGRVLWDGPAEPNSGTPAEIGGKGGERVLRAPRDGVVAGNKQIGDRVRSGETIARVDGEPVGAPFDGILRGLVRDGLTVRAGMKIGDVDARAGRAACFTISDKALAVGGGALEAILTWMNQRAR